MRDFGPGPTRSGVSSALITCARMIRPGSHRSPRHRGGGAGDHGVHEPGRGPGAGQRLDQLGAAVHRDGMRGDQVHAPRLQGQAVGDRPGAPRPPARRPQVHPAAPAGHLVQVMLGHRRGLQRDVHDLVAGGHAQVSRGGQVRAARAGSIREVRHPLIRAARTRPGANPGRLAACRDGARPCRVSASPPAACGRAGRRRRAAIEELPLLRPSRRRRSRTSAASATTSARSSPIAAACSSSTGPAPRSPRPGRRTTRTPAREAAERP